MLSPSCSYLRNRSIEEAAPIRSCEKSKFVWCSSMTLFMQSPSCSWGLPAVEAAVDGKLVRDTVKLSSCRHDVVSIISVVDNEKESISFMHQHITRHHQVIILQTWYDVNDDSCQQWTKNQFHSCNSHHHPLWFVAYYNNIKENHCWELAWAFMLHARIN